MTRLYSRSDVSSMPVLLGHPCSQRVVFVGPFGVGKTTAVRTISDIEVVAADVSTSERRADLPNKTQTTVGFDYGEMKLGNGESIGLFGLPGQSRFDAVWQAVLPGASAVVLWLFGDNPLLAEELEHWLQALDGYVDMATLSVAITRLPEDPGEAEQRLAALREIFAAYNPVSPILSADPRLDNDVRLAVAIALAAVEPGPRRHGLRT